MGIMEKKVETTIMGYMGIILGLYWGYLYYEDSHQPGASLRNLKLKRKRNKFHLLFRIYPKQ